MLKEQINELIKKFGLLRLAQFTLAAVILCLILVFILELIIPVSLNSNPIAFNNNPKDIEPESFQPDLNNEQLISAVRPGLFKASSTLKDKPLADKTIERIKSKLKLQCVMSMNGDLIAYVNIDGEGLRKCKVGDTVLDLFTVLSINKKSVEISILEHKVTLNIG